MKYIGVIVFIGFIVFIVFITFIVFIGFKGYKEGFANQYSLLSRDEPMWQHFGLTENPRQSNAPDPTLLWWQNSYWDSYDDKYKAHVNRPRTGKYPGFSPPCKAFLNVDDMYESRCNPHKLLYSNPKKFCNLHPEYRQCPYKNVY